jgi:hypothetical protein
VLAALITFGHFNERIPSNNQTGWDGKLYADIVISLDKQWQNKEIDGYLFQRILPSAIGYFLFYNVLQKEEVSRQNVVQYFLWLNTVLIALSVWGFFRICKLLSWSFHTELIGFSALFFNFAILKQAWYYPVLTDIMAFTFGIWLAYFFLSNKHIPAAIICILGAFVYPLFLPTALLLYLPVSQKLFVSKRIVFSVRLAAISLFCILMSAYILYPDLVLHPRYIMQVNKGLLPLSSFALLAYLWHITKPLSPKTIVAKVHGAPIMIPIILFITFLSIQFFIQQYLPQETNFTTFVFGMNIFQQSVSNPLAFIVFHSVYLGPLVLLMLVWKWDWARLSNLLLFVFTYLLLALGTETRQFINAWPILVIVFLNSVDSKSLHPKFILIFILMCLMQSHFYLTINQPGIYEQYEYGKFPEQFYFMHHGPFATPVSYVINISGCVLMALILYLAFRHLNPKS